MARPTKKAGWNTFGKTNALNQQTADRSQLPPFEQNDVASENVPSEGSPSSSSSADSIRKHYSLYRIVNTALLPLIQSLLKLEASFSSPCHTRPTHGQTSQPLEPLLSRRTTLPSRAHYSTVDSDSFRPDRCFARTRVATLSRNSHQNAHAG